MYKIIFGLTALTFLGQGIALCLLFLITRYFSQADFGEYGYLISIAGLISFAISFRMDSFIVRMTHNRLKVMLFPIVILIFLLCVVLFFICLFFKSIGYAFTLSSIVFFTFYINIMSVYVSRNALFRKLAISRLLKPVTTSFSQAILGYYTVINGLIYGGLLGLTIPSLYFSTLIKKTDFKNLYRKFKFTFNVINKMKSEICLISAQSIVTNVFQNTLLFYFYLRGDLISAGLIALLERCLKNPISMIASSIRNYSYSKIDDKSSQLSSYKPIILLSIITAVIISITALICLHLGIFNYLLSEKWVVSEIDFTFYLLFSAIVLCNSVNSPFILKNKLTKLIIKLDVLCVFTIIIFFFLDYFFLLGEWNFFVVFSCIYFLYFIFNCYFVIKSMNHSYAINSLKVKGK